MAFPCAPGAAVARAQRSVPHTRADALPPLALGATRLVLVRHGQAWSNLPAGRVPSSMADRDELTATGEEQARRVGDALRTAEVALVLVSPTRRTRQTAEIVASRIGATPEEVDARLGPLRSGTRPDGTQVTWDDRARQWRKGLDEPGSGGETIPDVLARVHAVLHAAVERHRGTTILVVAHTEVIAPLIGELQGRSPEKAEGDAVHNGSMTVIDVDAGGKWSLRTAGQMP